MDMDHDAILFQCIHKLDAVYLALQAEGPSEDQLFGLELIVGNVRDELQSIKNDMSGRRLGSGGRN
jgi:hypothetical protein